MYFLVFLHAYYLFVVKMYARSDSNVWHHQQWIDLARPERDAGMQHDVLLQATSRDTAIRYNLRINRLAVTNRGVYWELSINTWRRNIAD